MFKCICIHPRLPTYYNNYLYGLCAYIVGIPTNHDIAKSLQPAGMEYNIILCVGMKSIYY